MGSTAQRFAVAVPEPSGDEAADSAAFARWELDREKYYYPQRFGPDGDRLPEPRTFDFFVGVPEPSWLNRADGVPKFISAARLDRLVTRDERWPVTCVDPWAIDSGAYIALDGTNRWVPWWRDAETYASKILSFATDSGRPPDFVAPQDWPCEPGVRKKTGLTVREHQQMTLENYLFLVEEWPWLPWIPVLQGWEPGEHGEHARMYEDAGVDLAGCHRVGIGSVCRRAHLPEIVEVIAQFADAGLKLHGFGVKKTALPVIGHLLTSADSMAWSTNARMNNTRLPGCTHAGEDCRNCYRYAVHWREQTLAKLHHPDEEVTVPATAAPAKRTTRARKTPPPSLFDGMDLAAFGAMVAKAQAVAAPVEPVLLRTVDVCTYGEVTDPCWGPDGSKQVQRRGWVIKLPHVFTGGMAGHSNGRKYQGKQIVSFAMELTGGGHVGMYAPLDATFTVLEPPADHAEPRGYVSRSFRTPAQDVLPGHVFYVWTEPERPGFAVTDQRWNPEDTRPRYHVQGEPVLNDDGTCAIPVLVDGVGEQVTKTIGAQTWVDVEDRDEVPWKTVTACVATPYRLPGRIEWWRWRCTCGAEPPIDTRWSHQDLAQKMADHHAGISVPAERVRTSSEETPQHGLLGGTPSGDDKALLAVRDVLARSTYIDNVLRLPAEQLERATWEAVHNLLRQMGAKGGSRKGQPYRFDTDRSADLRAFIGGHPAPVHERSKLGWVRTPDGLAIHVVNLFAEAHTLGRKPLVLEPSAGDGSLVRAVLTAIGGAEVHAVEPVAERAAALREFGEQVDVFETGFEGFAQYHADTWIKPYDLIVMNPPYSVPNNKTIWIDHVRLAWSLLAEGGRLVAILPGDLRNRRDGPTLDLLRLIGPDVQVSPLPARSFKSSGTEIQTCVLTATRPGGTAKAATSRYEVSVFRLPQGEPEQVERPVLTGAAAVHQPVQAYRDFGGDRVVRYVGQCIACAAPTWSLDDGANDPRGMLGLKASAPLRAAEHDGEGPDLCLCYGCYDDGTMRHRGLQRAHQVWAGAGNDEPHDAAAQPGRDDQVGVVEQPPLFTIESLKAALGAQTAER